MKRCPNPHEGSSDIEIRQIYSTEEFHDVLTPELVQKEKELRKQSAEVAKKK